MRDMERIAGTVALSLALGLFPIPAGAEEPATRGAAEDRSDPAEAAREAAAARAEAARQATERTRAEAEARAAAEAKAAAAKAEAERRAAERRRAEEQAAIDRRIREQITGAEDGAEPK